MDIQRIYFANPTTKNIENKVVKNNSVDTAYVNFAPKNISISQYYPIFKARTTNIRVTKLPTISFDMLSERNKKHFKDLFSRLKVLDFEKLLKVYLKDPEIGTYKPETIENNIKTLIERFEKENLSFEEYAKACLKQSSLFHQSPNTVESNVRVFVDIISSKILTVEKYLEACLRQPQLFINHHIQLEIT